MSSKIVTRDTLVGPLVYADFYRFGEATERPPMVVYCGGATSLEVYQERSTTSPDVVADEFARALDSLSIPAVDLLVLPCPPLDEDEAATFRPGVMATLLFDLLPQTPNPRPPAMSFAGYSLGASLATFMTLSLACARGVAVFGAYGAATGGREANQIGGVESRAYRAFCNFDDTAYMDMLGLIMFLNSFEIDLEIGMRPGGHPFEDYACNDTVRDAFGFCLELLG